MLQVNIIPALISSSDNLTFQTLYLNNSVVYSGLCSCCLIHILGCYWRVVWWFPKFRPINMDMDRAMGLDCCISMGTCTLYWRIFNWVMLMD